jgi:hypothetical protein
MAKKVKQALGAGEEARYQAMAEWAENELPDAPATGGVRRGSDAAAHGRAALIAAGMDPAELSRLIGGRPSVDPAATPGRNSPQMNVRVSAELKLQIQELAHERGTKPSELARELLTIGVRDLQRANKDIHKREKHLAK